MPNQKPFSLLVVPDDEPPVLFGTPYEARARALSKDTEWHFDRPANEDESIARMKDSDAVINIRSSVQFTRRVLAACPKLKLLSVWGTGIDHVDLAAAVELGITVCNTPGYGAPYVAEHALTMALAVSRQIVQNDRYIREGGWTRGFINELYGKTLGVVGAGAIGQRMIQLGQGIGMNVIAWTVNASQERAASYGVEFVSLERRAVGFANVLYQGHSRRRQPGPVPGPGAQSLYLRDRSGRHCGRVCDGHSGQLPARRRGRAMDAHRVPDALCDGRGEPG